MRRVASGLMLMVLACAVPAWAEHSNGYFFIAPGGISCCGETSASVHLGAGGEAILGKGVGVGAELGALGAARDYPGSVFGLISLNGYYHFIQDRQAKLDPFATGGYSFGFRSGHINMGNYGGGVNYWFANRVGLRVELRDHVHVDGGSIHYWGVRFGVTFH